MADTAKQSPIGLNVLSSLINNTGFYINPVAQSFMGQSKTNTDYIFGTLVSTTALRLLTYAINDGYNRGPGNSNATLSNVTYNNLITIGNGTIPAFGNSIPPTYINSDPSNQWNGQATTGYSISGTTGQGQSATWLPYDTTNPNMSVTQWGYIRLHALQAWNEFNWNGSSVTQTTPSYKDFCGSFLAAYGHQTATNQVVQTVNNSNTFLNGVYSNMNDLISADIAGVSMSSNEFGTDLANLGNAIDLKNIATFGLPSNLLRTLGKNSAITQDLNVALLASGMSASDVTSIINGKNQVATAAQEKTIYGAFLIIAGVNLTTILASLQCKTQGFTTLADLLNVRMLFPNSYPSLTVPVYNATMGLPTNSKTYYLIYNNNGVNSAIDTQAVKNYVGTIVPAGTPPTFSNTLNPANYNQLPTGFGSYLDGIIPYDQAVAAGAFSYSMRQVRNIQNCSASKLGKVVQGMENTTDLPLVGGTSKPTDQTSTNNLISNTALGTGINGSFTMSDYFGCMSGLPYAWNLIQQRINELQTTKLYNIYQQLLLATEWEQATLTVHYTTSVISSTTYYQTTGVTINDPGGGYGRGGAPAPIITFSDGSTATCTIDTNDKNAGSNETGTYGRLVSVVFGTAGAATTTIPTAIVQAPPNATLAINSDGSVPTNGTNVAGGTLGWPNMNTVVQSYITQANTEITNIQQTGNQSSVQHLNSYWNTCGSQLKREQRARYQGIPPVPVPFNNFLYQTPLSLSVFVDSMSSMSQDTSPHQAMQTLEAISDFSTIGGQSVVALGRQERNQARLQTVGINLDNNIPATASLSLMNTYATNGTAPTTGEGISSPNGQTYTTPAWPSTVDSSGNLVNPIPQGIYVSPTSVPANSLSGFLQIPETTSGDITPILNGVNNPVVNTEVPIGVATNIPVTGIVVIAPAPPYDPTNVPPNLNPNVTNSTLLPASLSVPDAIDAVTTCNCECWAE